MGTYPISALGRALDGLQIARPGYPWRALDQVAHDNHPLVPSQRHINIDPPTSCQLRSTRLADPIMPRHARIILANVPIHLIQRGHNRQACFFVDQDYYTYLEWLRRHAVESDCTIHAYALMNNHVHLLLSAATPTALAAMMKAQNQQWDQVSVAAPVAVLAGSGDPSPSGCRAHARHRPASGSSPDAPGWAGTSPPAVARICPVTRSPDDAPSDQYPDRRHQQLPCWRARA